MKFNRLLMLFVVLLTVPSGGTFADRQDPPQDYKFVTPDQAYVFVMLDPEKGWLAFQDRPLRKKYLNSGLYKNDGSSEPLWTVSWYSHRHEVYLASDGVYLVRMGPWAEVWDDKDLEKGGPALNQLGVAFYKEGKLLKSYSIGELIEDATKLHQTVSHFRWEEKESFDEMNNHFMIQTLEGQKIVFDVSTGEIIEKKKDTSLIGKIDRALR